MLTSLLTLLAIARVWNRAFWRKPEDAEHPDPVLLAAPGGLGHGRPGRASRTSPCCRGPWWVPPWAWCIFGVALTVFAGPLFRVADQSAAMMLDRSSYIQAVLGEDAPVPALSQPARTPPAPAGSGQERK